MKTFAVVLGQKIQLSSSYLLTLLMMTAEPMLSKRPVLRFIVALFFLFKLLSSHIYCITRNCLLSIWEIGFDIQLNQSKGFN